MAPDLNSVPSSPRQQRARISHPPSTSNSRRPSQVMAASPAMHQSPVFAHTEHAGMPLRHPRPMTAAELHLELEKEQEAVVNRLTRELSTLRAQHSASVASVASNHSLSSTTSNPSLLPIDPTDPNPAHQITGPTHPTPSRRHRSSSSYSARNPNPTAPSRDRDRDPSVPAHGQSQASHDRATAAGASAAPPTNLSRNPSISASGTSTPARTGAELHQAGLTLPHRPPLSQSGSYASSTYATAGSAGGTPLIGTLSGGHQGGGAGGGSLGLALGGAGPTSNPGAGITSGSFVDAERARQELEVVKSENEALREKVRSLERMLRRRRESGTSVAPSVAASEVVGSSVAGTGQGTAGVGAGGVGTVGVQAGGVNVSAWAAQSSGTGTGNGSARERSESQSTEASVRRQLAGVSQEERDEAVKVGESAGSAGMR
ncbi:hypothetical protein C1H76_1316 [Elsinoe australis]|uniref:Uncharacterized protein n=1 Tax=Elsinoe australis TaxID=40998 RepID=A0A4U7BD34_9PEZI|nr:hypothetical protein C1H76_1316 [Elsinoe australis]